MSIYVFNNFSWGAALNGNYTIGGTSPNYATCTSAVSDLVSKGVSGPVIFKIRSGTYSEQINITAITGASATNTITFQSESGTNTDVVLSYTASTSSTNYVIKLNAANYITVKNMSLQNNGATYCTVVNYTNGANYNTLTNCVISGGTGSLTSGALIVSSTSYLNQYNQITNNIIQNGVYGIYYNGKSSSSLAAGIIISNNTISNISSYNIYVKYADAPVISQNTINVLASSSNTWGIYLHTDINALRVEKNKITGGKGYGIYITTTAGTASNYALVDNNFIQVTNNTGIYVSSSCSYIKFYYNTINITATISGYYAFYFASSASNLEVKNNIIANTTGGGYAIYSGSSTSITSSSFDYNDYYTTGSSLMKWAGTSVSNLAAWQTLTGYDLHSISTNPTFTSSTDLHASATALNSMGTGVSEVTTDIDGETRSVTTPDIGADEMPLSASDAGLTAFTSPVVPFAAGSKTISVTLLNNSAATLTSATIAWSVNGIAQTNYNWTGSINAGSSSSINIGTYTFVSGTPYTLNASVSMPNGSDDIDNSNDEISLSTFYTSYSGTYTVGSSGYDFNSLNDAITKIQLGGMLASVTLNIQDGSYIEQLNIGEIPGASSANMFTLQSASSNNTSVIISYPNTSSNNYVIKLDGTDYISFKNLTIKSASTSNGKVITISNGANHNLFEGNKLTGVENYDAVVYCDYGTLNEYNEFKNNSIQYGKYGIYYYGQSGSSQAKGISISSNTCEYQYTTGIYGAYLDAPSISGNTISTNSNYFNYEGIALTYCKNGLQITSNKIAGGTGYGIQISVSDGTTLQYGLIANNFIETASYSSGSTIWDAYGIGLDNCNYLKIYNNNVNVIGNESENNTYALYIKNGSNTAIKNNILLNETSGYSLYCNSSSSISACDYNDLYSRGNSIAFLNSTTYTNLGNWQAGSGFDVHSLQINPLYVSNSDLHIQHSLLNNSGIKVSEVTTDIDGETRSTSTPDIGADEKDVFPTLIDAGINALLSPNETNGLGENDTVKIQIENYGNTVISGFDVAYIANSGIQVTENIGSVTIDPGERVDYTFNTVLTGLAALKSLPIKVFTLLGSETNSTNDTLSSTLQWLPDLQVTNITVANSFYIDNTIDLSWTVTNKGNGSTGSESWHDHVWLSKDEDLRMADDILLTTVSNLTYLHTNQSYIQNLSVKIPEGTSAGNYLLFVTTNVYDAYCVGNVCYDGVERASHLMVGNIDEIYYDNNFAYDSIFLENPPSADLKVTSIGIQTSAYSGDSATVTYAVKNSGTFDVSSQTWTDDIYICSCISFDASAATLIGSVSNSLSLAVDASYSISKKVKLPNAIYGDYYIYVYTNENKGVKEYENTYSNISKSDAAINMVLTPPADLVPSSVSSASTGNSGQPISVSWTVTNSGANAPYESLWKDKVYISTSSSFNINSATLIGTYYKLSGSSLSVGSSYTATETYTLPNGISGSYYIYVFADADSMVFEYDKDNNNTIKSSSAITISLSPYPDLIVNSSTIDDIVYAGYSSTISWSVKNQGTTSLSLWIDGIYLSSDKTLSSDDVLLDTIANSVALSSGQTTTINNTVTFSDCKLSGKYYIIINTDNSDLYYEYNGESNNTFVDSVTINWKYANLSITSFTIPSSANSGTTISTSWQVQNIGTGITYSSSWYDYIYLSTDNVYDATDIKLEYENRSGSLDASSTYSKTIDVDIPDGVVGSYYLLLDVDAKSKVTNESDYSNNFSAQAISITLSPSSDLVVSTITVPTSVYAGQQVYVPYTVKNQGSYATEKSNWYVGIYVSNTTDLSDYEINLKNKSANLILDAGITYTDSVLVSIPSYLSGNYYIVAYADYNDKLYEYLHEDNNLNAGLSNILVPSTDLTVTAMTIPSAITLGTEASIAYTITNSGDNVAVGDLRDIAYLSSNNLLSTTEDLMVQYKDSSVAIDPGQSISCSMSGTVKDIMPGNYYGITKTNALNNILESDIDNNEFTTAGTTTVSVSPLTLDVISTHSLDYDDNVYYQVSVSANLDLLLSLTSNLSATGYNEIYVGYNRMPSATDYDFIFENEASLNQQVLIPTTQAGTYYIFIKTLSMFSTAQTISVLAEALPFSILNISPNVVGQGKVTCTIEGAGFKDGIQIYLEDDSHNRLDTAYIKNHTNSMAMDIRWSLDNVALGTYNVVAVNTDLSTTTLTHGLTVEPAEEYNISYTKYAPELIKKGGSAFYTYEITNASNIDIPYFSGYFKIDSTVEITETKINGNVFVTSIIDTQTGEQRYWAEIKGEKYIPVHLKDLQPNEKVKIDFTFKNFEMDTFNILFAYTTFSKETMINNILTDADVMQERIFNNLSYFEPILGSDLINFFYDQVNFRKFVIAALVDIKDLSPEDTVGIDYSYISSTSAFLASKLKSSQALSDCDFADVLQEFVNTTNAELWDAWKAGLADTNPAIAIALSDDATEAVTGTALTAAGIVATIVDAPAIVCAGIVFVGVGIAGLGLYSIQKDLMPCGNNINNNPYNDGGTGSTGRLIGSPSSPSPSGGDEDDAPTGNYGDPNEIVGSEGIAEKKWISINDELYYTIYTENDSLATAPAQYIEITQQLDEHVDPYSLKLGKYGFANMSFDIPENSLTYSTTLDLEDTLGVDVEVTAGLDITNNRIFWIFNAIDPNTGKAPVDPTKGILQANDSTGIGEGFAMYTISPSSGCNTGDSIYAYADIIFGVNEAVLTETIFNTVDAHAPVTTMSPLAASYTSPSFTLAWNGVDDDGNGSGIYNYDVYVSHNGEAFELYTENTTATSVAFIGNADDVSLSFYVVAIDSVGNQETKSVSDVSTSIGSITVTSPNGGESSCASSSRTITWTSSNVSSFNLYYSSNGGTTYTSIASGVTGSSYSWTLPATAGTYLVKVANAANTAMYDVSNATFTINALPTASITSSTGSTTTFCTSATLTASSASSYSWSTGSTASSISITATGTYSVTVTNSNGCSANASKSMTKKSKPTANYSYTTPSAKKAVFTNTSSGASSYSWNFGDGTTSTSTSPSKTYTAGGTYSVVLTATNTCGSSTKTKSVTVSSTKTDLSTINEMGINSDEVLWPYPNPSSGLTNIDVYVENEESDVEIKIINLTGEIVQKIYSGKLESGSHTFNWDASQFNSGMYIIMLREDEQLYQKRLTVIKN